MKREMGLDYLMRKYILSPFEQNKFSEDCHSYFLDKFPDFSLTFKVLSKFPWPSTKFPDLEKISFSRHFSLTMATLRTDQVAPRTTYKGDVCSDCQHHMFHETTEFVCMEKISQKRVQKLMKPALEKKYLCLASATCRPDKSGRVHSKIVEISKYLQIYIQYKTVLTADSNQYAK